MYVAMDFPEVFSNSLAASGLGKAVFAKAVGVSPGFVSQVLSGERPPPLDRMPAWAEALKLKGENYSKFVNAAISRHVPVAVLQAAKAHAEMLEHWLEDERGDTGPWRLDLHGRLTESPRTRELKALRERVATLEAERHENATDDLHLQVVGRAAAAHGAHVDGETDQPDPIRIRSRWRVHVISGDSGGDVVLPGQSVITDPALKPKRNRLVVIPSDNGPVLKRWGELHGDSVVVASISGMDPCLVPLAELGSPEVVVGVLFTDSVAK